MKANGVIDLSDSFLNYLEDVVTQANPVLADSTDQILELIGRIEGEGFIAPAGLTIEQVLGKALDFVNARLPSAVRIVNQQTGVFVATVAYLDQPGCV